MSEEEKAISELKSLYVHSENITYEQKFAIATALNLIKKLEKEAQKYFEENIKKDKIIDLMTEHIQNGCDFDNRIKTKKDIKQYFKSKVEKECI